MKNINKSILGVALAAVALTSLTGCIDETYPTTVATDEMVAASPSATEGLALGMPAKTIELYSSSYHYAFGYPAQMIIRDMMTGDGTYNGETGYSWFSSWNQNRYMGDGYAYGQFHWNYYYGFLLSVNGVIAAVNEEEATPVQLGYKGDAYAFRAMLYLDLGRMYEFLPTDVNPTGVNADGNIVLGMSVPIVTDETTAEEANNNARATHKDMVDFILSDLEKAEKLIVNEETTVGNTMPDLACVYGLYARLYMWDGGYQREINKDESAAKASYAAAQKYARLAIDNCAESVMSESEGLSTTNGYNTASDFMWCGQQTSEADVVSTGIINWTSWASNQTTFGYTGAATGLYYVCDKKFYERISDTDWRKLEFKAPAGSALDGKVPYLNADEYESMPDYTAIKFRPNAGNEEDYSTGASTAVPLMRVEEMYFTEAEAAAQQGNVDEAKTLVTTFMQKYRDASYTCSASDQDSVIEEIIFQKRVELWGEGLMFFDLKRLGYAQTRGYSGTNWQEDKAKLNTQGRPAWMNYVIVRTEEQNGNEALTGWNNPDPTDLYTPWSE